MRARHLLVLLLVLASSAALVPSVAQGATPQLRKMTVMDAQYCLALGMRPRVQVELSARGRVMFSVWSIDPSDPLRIPKQTAGPKRTATLPAGVSVLQFPDALGKTPRDFKPLQQNILVGIPFSGWRFGTPSIDVVGFMRLPACG